MLGEAGGHQELGQGGGADLQHSEEPNTPAGFLRTENTPQRSLLYLKYNKNLPPSSLFNVFSSKGANECCRRQFYARLLRKNVRL